MKHSIPTFMLLFSLAMYSTSSSQHLTPQPGWYGGVSGDEILMILMRANNPRPVVDSVIFYVSVFGHPLKRDTIVYNSTLDNQDCFSTPIRGGVTGGELDGFVTQGCFQSNTQISARIIYLNVFQGADTSNYFSLSPGFVITGVGGEANGFPLRPLLLNSYPNPFNPSTTITFSLPSRSYVSLEIFDPLGRLVSTLVADELSAGQHSRQWNASGLPSGVYFYRLVAGSFADTKKLVLLK
jgi:hypothetical protein